MPVYEFTCRDCGEVVLTRDRDSVQEYNYCQSCFGLLRRRFSFSYVRGTTEHFNLSVGKPISSQRQFRDELARKSDEMSARLGMDVNYQPVDPTPEAVGADREVVVENHRKVELAQGGDRKWLT